MAHDRALVRNAADKEQVSRASRKVRDREGMLDASLRAVLAHPAGRHVFADLLERAGLYQSTFHPNVGQMCLNEGRRQFGLELLALLTDADATLYDLLEAERRARHAADDRETDARQMKTDE